MSDRILLATRKGTLILDRVGGRWKARPISHPGVNVAYAAADPRDGTLWASLDHGHWGPKLSRSKDGGETWEDTPSIKYPAGARYVAQYMPLPDEDPFEVSKRPQYKDAIVLKNWVIGFAGPDQPGVMHVGTIPGGLFTSRDGGESWELNLPLWNHESRGGDLFAGEATSENKWMGTPAAAMYGEFAPGIHSIVIDPRDSNRFFVAVSSAGVLETTDGGRSWAARNRGMLNDYMPDPEAEWSHDPHFVTASRANPERMWQQNHSGVFASEDGARTWKRVSDTGSAVHFGFPIATDPTDGRTAWVVPGRADMERMAVDRALFVGRTQDGGASWQTFREGLPQSDAYDIVYRHGLDVSADGRRLCFASTTGNVYVSEDAGESWTSAGSNFPPVHSVRFA